MKSPERLPPVKIYEYLVDKADRELLNAYVGYILLLSRRGLRRHFVHPKTFNLLYRAVSHSWPEQTLLGRLQREFIKRNISLSLLIEPVDGFEWLYKNHHVVTLDKLSAPLMQIIAPFSRLIALLNNQTPPFYQPFSVLVFAYLLFYASSNQDRLGLKTIAAVKPKELLAKAVLSSAEAKEVLAVTKFSVFKLKLAFFVGLCRVTGRKNTKKSTGKINFFDYVNAFLYGLWYIITIRNKTRGLSQI